MNRHPAATRHLILRLLYAGHSRLEVAHLAGVSPATVSRLHRGWPRPRPRPVNPHVIEPDVANPPPGYNPRRIRRCPGCGGQVYLWPCLRCELHGEMQFPAEFRRRKRCRKRP